MLLLIVLVFIEALGLDGDGDVDIFFVSLMGNQESSAQGELIEGFDGEGSCFLSRVDLWSY